MKNQQKSQTRSIPYVKKQNNKRKKTKTEGHKSLHHFFFVAPTLIGFLVALETPFLGLPLFLEV